MNSMSRFGSIKPNPNWLRLTKMLFLACTSIGESFSERRNINRSARLPQSLWDEIDKESSRRRKCLVSRIFTTLFTQPVYRLAAVIGSLCQKSCEANTFGKISTIPCVIFANFSTDVPRLDFRWQKLFTSSSDSLTGSSLISVGKIWVVRKFIESSEISERARCLRS